MRCLETAPGHRTRSRNAPRRPTGPWFVAGRGALRYTPCKPRTGKLNGALKAVVCLLATIRLRVGGRGARIDLCWRRDAKKVEVAVVGDVTLHVCGDAHKRIADETPMLLGAARQPLMRVAAGEVRDGRGGEAGVPLIDTRLIDHWTGDATETVPECAQSLEQQLGQIRALPVDDARAMAANNAAALLIRDDAGRLRAAHLGGMHKRWANEDSGGGRCTQWAIQPSATHTRTADTHRWRHAQTTHHGDAEHLVKEPVRAALVDNGEDEDTKCIRRDRVESGPHRGHQDGGRHVRHREEDEHNADRREPTGVTNEQRVTRTDAWHGNAASSTSREVGRGARDRHTAGAVAKCHRGCPMGKLVQECADKPRRAKDGKVRDAA
eukprot:7379930-Prymnesium_polylepis.1